MQVEIWSDVVCPWCYIGKRRFEAALARFDHGDAVHVRWRSFELDPVQRLTAGAVGEPGRRAFFIQGRHGDTLVSLLVEKQQVAALSATIDAYSSAEHRRRRARLVVQRDREQGRRLGAGRLLQAADRMAGVALLLEEHLAAADRPRRRS